MDYKEVSAMTQSKQPFNRSKRKVKCKAYLKYQRYLRTKKWREIRDLVLERDEHRCVCCSRTERLTVHHSCYDHLYNEREHLKELVTLCVVCHSQIHRSPSNYQRFKMKETVD